MITDLNTKGLLETVVEFHTITFFYYERVCNLYQYVLSDWMVREEEVDKIRSGKDISGWKNNKLMDN